jgi:hypothetical protein
MTTRLPLVAAQPGIWMAERLSTLPGAWSVAHYVELRGASTRRCWPGDRVARRRPTRSACALRR